MIGKLGLQGYKLCPDCGQPVLRKGQTRKHPDDYQHANGCTREALELRVEKAESEVARLRKIEAAAREIPETLAADLHARGMDYSAKRVAWLTIALSALDGQKGTSE